MKCESLGKSIGKFLKKYQNVIQFKK